MITTTDGLAQTQEALLATSRGLLEGVFLPNRLVGGGRGEGGRGTEKEESQVLFPGVGVWPKVFRS